jgi:hypothetical protein
MIQGLQLLESCSFTWIFDGATRLFRRMPRDSMVSLDIPAGWVPYHRLDVDELHSCFAVVLNEAGTGILRAWLHSDPCSRCSRPRRRHPLRPYGGWRHVEGAY